MYSTNIHMTANNIQFTKIEIEIAMHLFKHYKEKYNPRQLAKVLNINHAHANKLCSLLADKNLLKKEEMGNSIYFSYAYHNPFAIKFMEYMLSLEINNAPQWLIVLLHTLKKYDEHIEMGLIFGSSIKTQDFQDIDILLMYDKSKTKIVKRIKDEIRTSELIEKPIRSVDITEEDIALNKENKVFYSMLSDNLVFHNPEKYVAVIKKCHKLMNI